METREEKEIESKREIGRKDRQKDNEILRKRKGKKEKKRMLHRERENKVT
jgi:hypothetical protein